MQKTTKELMDAGMCDVDVMRASDMFGDPIEISRDNILTADKAGLNVLYLTLLLPKEGLYSQRHFAYECEMHVSHLITDKRVHDCLRTVKSAILRHRNGVDVDVDAKAWAAEAAGAAAAWAAAWAAERLWQIDLLCDFLGVV